MLPASLDTNFLFELKKCGDPQYRKHQHWTFHPLSSLPSTKQLSVDIEYVKEHGGVWLSTPEKPDNFASLSDGEQNLIDQQINRMIGNQYQTYHYNGNSPAAYNALTKKDTINPFDHAVVIIDEAHNLVSRIVNKLPKSSTKVTKVTNQFEDQESMKLYQYLMSAVNARIVMLTGTPIINYPNEVGVLFNILRGTTKTWEFTLDVSGYTGTLDRDTFLDLFTTKTTKNNKASVQHNVFDYVQYSNRVLTVTRNPFGFVNQFTREYQHHKTKKGGKIRVRRTKKVNVGGAGEFEKYKGMVFDPTCLMTDHDFEQQIRSVLVKHHFTVVGNVRVTDHKCLPDQADTFKQWFINTTDGTMKEQDLFQRRILGLTSYFKSTQESLLPAFELTPDGNTYHMVRCEMSSYQFAEYDKIRKTRYKE